MLRFDRSEPVIHAKANGVKGKVGREAVSRVGGANEGCANKAIVRRSQVYVQVFCLNGPISRVHPFNTGAGSPTDMIFTGGRNCSHQTAWNYVRDNIVEPVPNVASYLARLDTFRTCEH